LNIVVAVRSSGCDIQADIYFSIGENDHLVE
jgi:hypothetical protein